MNTPTKIAEPQQQTKQPRQLPVLEQIIPEDLVQELINSKGIIFNRRGTDSPLTFFINGRIARIYWEHEIKTSKFDIETFYTKAPQVYQEIDGKMVPYLPPSPPPLFISVTKKNSLTKSKETTFEPYIQPEKFIKIHRHKQLENTTCFIIIYPESIQNVNQIDRMKTPDDAIVSYYTMSQNVADSQNRVWARWNTFNKALKELNVSEVTKKRIRLYISDTIRTPINGRVVKK
jgi:hypothetical protein